MSIESRLSKLEQQAAPEATSARGIRHFSTFDGVTYLETTDCVFDHQQAPIGANGEWPAFVEDKLATREQLDAIEREGWQVSIVRW